jgi:hypothetical protein
MKVSRVVRCVVESVIQHSAPGFTMTVFITNIW